jgi:hypothetical protein
MKPARFDMSGGEDDLLAQVVERGLAPLRAGVAQGYPRRWRRLVSKPTEAVERDAVDVLDRKAKHRDDRMSAAERQLVRPIYSF